MVGAARLKRTGTRFAALLAAVLVLHLIVLRWVARELEASSVLHAMPAPMFTRLLQQAAEPAPPPALPTAAPARPRSRHVEARSVPTAKPSKRAASQPSLPSSPSTPEAEAQTAAPSPSASSTPTAAAASETLPLPLPATPVAQAVAGSASLPASATTSASDVAVSSTGSWPADTRLNYRLGGQFRSGELHGSARVQWLRREDKYEAKIDIDVTFLARLILTSQGEVTPQGLFPRAYEELRGSGPRNARLGDEAIVLHDGRSVPRPPSVQDTASQFVELSHRFSSGQEVLQVGRSVSIWLARPGGVDLWTYDIVERETLRTPQLGDVDAFHLKPRALANPRGNITAEMWFAPSLQYLPVRIKVTMGESTYVDLMVDQIEQR